MQQVYLILVVSPLDTSTMALPTRFTMLAKSCSDVQCVQC